MFAVFIAGLHIPVPGIDAAAMNKLFGSGGILGLLDVFSGGALRKYTIFAMGITPYINASIIMQLLGVAIPQMEQLRKEGEAGQKKIAQYTRYMTVVLAVVQAVGLNLMLFRGGILSLQNGAFTFIQIVVVLTAGTAFLMWLGEQITANGIGNGVSLIIFCSIMARIPFDVSKTWELAINGGIKFYNVLALVIVWILTVAGIVYITQATRKIPIQHAKRVVGNRVYGGTSTDLPLKVNSAGVIPIIFAMSVQLFPTTILQFIPKDARYYDIARRFVEALNPGQHWIGAIIYVVFIVFFTYFYTAVSFNPAETADNLKKWGAFIPGIRPGKPTLEYLDKVMTRITLAGAVFLAVIALLQYFVPNITGVPTTAFSLIGGTSLLIVVGVALETMQQIEAHLVMRSYEGFIK
jgi:preprotein translocase subunit SecY